MNIYSNFSQFKNCHSCNSSSHTLANCPLIHFVPCKDFLIKRLLHSEPHHERREIFERKKKKFSCLKKLATIQESQACFVGNNESDSEILSSFQSINEDFERKSDEISRISEESNENDDDNDDKMFEEEKKEKTLKFVNNKKKHRPSLRVKIDNSFKNIGSPMLNVKHGSGSSNITNEEIIKNNRRLSTIKSGTLIPEKSEQFISSPIIAINQIKESFNEDGEIRKRKNSVFRSQCALFDSQDFFCYEFETAAVFKKYFKHNNKDVVIKKFKRMRSKSPTRRKI